MPKNCKKQAKSKQSQISIKKLRSRLIRKGVTIILKTPSQTIVIPPSMPVSINDRIGNRKLTGKTIIIKPAVRPVKPLKRVKCKNQGTTTEESNNGSEETPELMYESERVSSKQKESSQGSETIINKDKESSQISEITQKIEEVLQNKSDSKRNSELSKQLQRVYEKKDVKKENSEVKTESQEIPSEKEDSVKLMYRERKIHRPTVIIRKPFRSNTVQVIKKFIEEPKNRAKTVKKQRLEKADSRIKIEEEKAQTQTQTQTQSQTQSQQQPQKGQIPQTPFKFYCQEMTQQSFKVSRQLWSNLKDKQKYIEMAEKDLERYKNEQIEIMKIIQKDNRTLWLQEIVKETAIQPKGRKSSHALFFKEEFDILKKQNPDIMIIEANKVINKKWKEIQPKEKERLQKLSEEDLKRYNDQMKELKNNGYFITQDGVKSNQLMADNSYQILKKYHQKMPKHKNHAFAYFLKDRVKNIMEVKKMNYKDANILCNKIWKEMSEKQKYYDMEKADKIRYETQMKDLQTKGYFIKDNGDKSEK